MSSYNTSNHISFGDAGALLFSVSITDAQAAVNGLRISAPVDGQDNLPNNSFVVQVVDRSKLLRVQKRNDFSEVVQVASSTGQGTLNDNVPNADVSNFNALEYAAPPASQSYDITPLFDNGNGLSEAQSQAKALEFWPVHSEGINGFYLADLQAELLDNIKIIHGGTTYDLTHTDGTVSLAAGDGGGGGAGDPYVVPFFTH